MWLVLPAVTKDKDSVTVSPLWHVKQNGRCDCINNLRFRGIIECYEDCLIVKDFFCITWDDEIESVRAAYCLFTPMDSEFVKRTVTIFQQTCQVQN